MERMYSTATLQLDSSFSTAATDSSSNVASSSSTPPTTIADTASQHSDASKQDMITVAGDAHALDEQPSSPVQPLVANVDTPANESIGTSSASRSRRSRGEGPCYNLAKLSGTAGHGKRRTKGDVVSARHLKRALKGQAQQGTPTTPTFESPALDVDSPAPSVQATPTKAKPNTPPENGDAVSSAANALQLRLTPKRSSSGRLRTRPATAVPVKSPRRMSTRTAAALAPAPQPAKSKSTKRSRKSEPALPSALSRELARLQDTPEFAHQDKLPVIHTVWSNGKYVDPNEVKEPPKKKAKVDPKSESESDSESDSGSEPVTNLQKRRAKKWLDRGLYSGQDTPTDTTKGLTPGEKKKLSTMPDLKKRTPNSIMPSPLFNGLRTLINGRDFKLPYHVCNPLPPGQPKPDEWKRMTKNRFIGDSKEYWRKSPHFHDCSSKCVCKKEDGCGESCQNRIMLYECDSSNCNVGKEFCRNRAFADLTARRVKGGKYRVGVEVIKTSDRGYGVRSNRCFRPGQIIMEYAGEIITEEECERRMNEVYKDNECYYLMSFDQNMIIDATTGSSARFVNHSCDPNCRMIKWIVSGQPRMALFAGDRPIMTGDELTYDYNFDPFSAKNVQKCLCGSENCRGILGPKPREPRGPKALVKTAVQATMKAGKRKLDELMGGEKQGSGNKAKKRKIQPIKSVKQALSAVGLGATKKTAAALKKGVSNVMGGKKTALTSNASAANRIRTGTTIVKKKTTATKRVVKTYSKGAPTKKTTVARSKTTIVAKANGVAQARKSPPRKRTPTKKAAAALALALTAKTKPPTPKSPLGKKNLGKLSPGKASEINVMATS